MGVGRVDGRQFDAWTATLDENLRNRRSVTRLLTLSGAGLLGAALAAPTAEAKKKNNKKKKKKKKKRCKQNLETCSGNKTCCSKICCLNTSATLRFCVPSGGACCPAGGACPGEAPVCCNAASGPNSCTTSSFPVCCFANSAIPYDYGCAAGSVCCADAASGGCCAPGAARAQEDGATGNQRLSALLGGE